MTHLLVRTECAPGEPDGYIGRCGYRSEIKKEFAVEMAKVTCERCTYEIRRTIEDGPRETADVEIRHGERDPDALSLSANDGEKVYF